MPIKYDEEIINEDGQGTAGNGLPWWNQPVGSHRVKILEEGEQYTAKYRNQEIQKVRYVIEVNGTQYNWGVNKGKTSSSLWGQLVLLGREWGSLAGKTISLIIKTTTRRDGTTIRQFTVVEAVNLQAAKAQQTQQQNPQPQQGNMREMMNIIRGKPLNKQQIMASLNINETQLESLVVAGLIQKSGNTYTVI